MPVFFQSRAGRQCVSIVGFGVTLWLLGTLLQLDDSLVSFMIGFGEYGADKLVLALGIAGAMSFIYSVLRIADLRKEMELRATAQSKADWTATHDHLTKLPNRYAFERKILSRPIKDDEAEIEEWDRNVTIFSVDLDGFKKVNDLVGHKGGDILLIEVARRICALGNADCVYRFGGDEFIIVAFALTSQREERFARLLIQAVTRPIHIDGFAVEVGASVGYDRWVEEAEPLEDAAHRADLAMYEAKSRGPNHYFAFEPSMQDKVTERAALETRLRAAISNKAIKPFYQPLIDLKTGQLCGFEALARWIGDDGVNIPPPVFIDIAEETGMITALFEDLLAQACSDALTWPEHVTLSFNVSPVQMEDRLLTSRILKVLSASRLPPQRLEVEITENALIQDPAVAALILDELHAAGIQIALDDFGTGYSSLAYLKALPLDYLKIDSQLSQDITGSARGRVVVTSVIEMARSLGLSVVAEGVENEEQLALLARAGCNAYQGFIFSPPINAKELGKLMSGEKVSR
jgi:diguanylate cyclase (GGDEF)-like protein